MRVAPFIVCLCYNVLQVASWPMVKRLAPSQSDENYTIYTFPPFEADGCAFEHRSDASYLTGFTVSSFDGQPFIGQTDGYLTRFNADGSRQWSRIFGSPTQDTIYAVAVATFENNSVNESVGNDASTTAIFVCGMSTGSFDGARNQNNVGGSTADMLVMRFDSDGRKIWTRLYGTFDNDICHSLAVDVGRNAIYVAGITFGSLNGQRYLDEGDVALMRISMQTGDVIWTSVFGTVNMDTATAISVGSGYNDIFVGGVVGGSIDQQPFSGGVWDGFCARYNADGQRIRTALIGSPKNDWLQAVEFVADIGAVFIGGTTQGVLTNVGDNRNHGLYDAFGGRLAVGDLSVRWLTQYGGFGFDTVTNIVRLSKTKSIYLTGFSTYSFDDKGSAGGGPAAGQFDMFLSSMRESDGKYIGTKMFGSSGSDYGMDACVDSRRNLILIAGRFKKESAFVKVNVTRLFGSEDLLPNHPSLPVQTSMPASTSTALFLPIMTTGRSEFIASQTPQVSPPEDQSQTQHQYRGSALATALIVILICIAILFAVYAVFFRGRYGNNGYHTIGEFFNRSPPDGGIQLE